MSGVSAFSNTPPDDMSHVGRAVDFTPGKTGILAHFVVCGLAPEDVPCDAAASFNQRVPAPQVLYHWAAPGAAPLPEQLMDFCFPVDRRATLQWVSIESPLLRDALCDPQHETVDPFVFLISGEQHPLIGVALSRMEIARVPPPLVVKPHDGVEDPSKSPAPPAKSSDSAEESSAEQSKEEKEEEKEEEDKKEQEIVYKAGDESAAATAPQEETEAEATTTEEQPKQEEPKKEESKKEEEPGKCYVAVTRRVYVILSEQCLLPLLSEMLSAIVGVDFAASAENRRTLLEVVLARGCVQTEVDAQLAACAVAVPAPPPLARAMMEFCSTALAVPRPGEVLQFRLPSVAALPQAARVFRCPPAPTVRDAAMSVLMEWALVTLFEYLSLPNVLTVLAAVWCERSVLFVCPDVAVLTSLVFALLPASRPLAWQGIFIPLLPTTMSDCIDAPVPYVIGIPCLPGDAPPAAHRVDGVIVVDVLRNTLYNWGDPVPALPNARVLTNKLRPLHAAVFVPPQTRASNTFYQPALRGSAKRLSTAQSLAACLAEYTTWILSQIKSHYRDMCARAGTPVPLAALEKSFIASSHRANRPFVTGFIGTQQFATYFHWNISFAPPQTTTPPQRHT